MGPDPVLFATAVLKALQVSCSVGQCCIPRYWDEDCALWWSVQLHTSAGWPGCSPGSLPQSLTYSFTTVCMAQTLRFVDQTLPWPWYLVFTSSSDHLPIPTQLHHPRKEAREEPAVEGPSLWVLEGTGLARPQGSSEVESQVVRTTLLWGVTALFP